MGIAIGTSTHFTRVGFDKYPIFRPTKLVDHFETCRYIWHMPYIDILGYVWKRSCCGGWRSFNHSQDLFFGSLIGPTSGSGRCRVAIYNWTPFSDCNWPTEVKKLKQKVSYNPSYQVIIFSFRIVLLQLPSIQVVPRSGYVPFVPYFDRIELGAMWSEAEHMQDEERSRCRWSLARGWAEEAEEISRCPTVSSLPKTFRKFLAEDFSTKLLKIIWTTSGFQTDLALHFQRHLIAAQHSLFSSVGIIWNNLNPKKTSPTSCQKSIWVNYNDLTVLPNPGIMV